MSPRTPAQEAALDRAIAQVGAERCDWVDDETEVRTGLAVARLLVAHGAHLMLFRPAMAGGAWEPRGGTGRSGYWFDEDWQHSEYSADVVDRWSPGMALAMVCGHVFDAVDNDPRNGGDKIMERLADAMPPVLMTADTPSSGQHHLIGALGITKTALGGVDIQAGLGSCDRARPKCNGGHGFIFLAPTRKWSKTLDRVDRYRWVGGAAGLVAPDLSASVGAPLRSRITEMRAEMETERRARSGLEPVAGGGRPALRLVTDTHREFSPRQADEFIAKQVVARVREARAGTVANTLFAASALLGHFVPGHLDDDSAEAIMLDALASCAGNDGSRTWDEMHEIRNGIAVGQNEWQATMCSGLNPFARYPDFEAIEEAQGGIRPLARFNGHGGTPDDCVSDDSVPGVVGEIPRWFDRAGLRAEDCAIHLRGLAPVAVTREGGVAVYADGVYRINEAALRVVTIGMLRNRWNVGHHNTIANFLAAQLYGEGLVLPERMAEPLVNFADGMLDLRTLELHPHDPRHMSTFQLPFAWSPDAPCPTYLRWVQMIDVVDQLVDLEETVGQMFDPSRTPTKALFVFGPARSGKSTYLRLMATAAGSERTSGLSLQDLATDRYASANLYGMVLNVCADLSAAHVEDVSLFKKLTGQDLIAANRKYGRQFTFTNAAMFAFSGNTLPTVSESSRAYLERMKPISFANSFAGAEDPSIEDAMMVELPGIVARWVRRYHERLVRGAPTPTLPRVAAQFAEASNRVLMWLASEVHVGPGYWATTTTLHDGFKRWCDQEGGARAMGKTKFAEQLRSAPGVESATNSANKARGWTACLKPFGG